MWYSGLALRLQSPRGTSPSFYLLFYKAMCLTILCGSQPRRMGDQSRHQKGRSALEEARIRELGGAIPRASAAFFWLAEQPDKREGAPHLAQVRDGKYLLLWGSRASQGRRRRRRRRCRRCGRATAGSGRALELRRCLADREKQVKKGGDGAEGGWRFPLRGLRTLASPPAKVKAWSAAPEKEGKPVSPSRSSETKGGVFCFLLFVFGRADLGGGEGFPLLSRGLCGFFLRARAVGALYLDLPSPAPKSTLAVLPYNFQLFPGKGRAKQVPETRRENGSSELWCPFGALPALTSAGKGK